MSSMRARDDAAILILYKKQEDQKIQIVKSEKKLKSVPRLLHE